MSKTVAITKGSQIKATLEDSAVSGMIGVVIDIKREGYIIAGFKDHPVLHQFIKHEDGTVHWSLAPGEFEPYGNVVYSAPSDTMN